ncbi:hypothetical protein N0V90_005226, partial [Kalmusia sp. IMI 367209]
MRSFVIASLAAVALADTQIKFFLPGMDSADDGGVDPVASIVKADASTTVMALACPTNADDTECGWGQNDITISVIQSTIYSVSLEAQSVAFECTSKKDMSCTAAIAMELTDAGSEFTAGSDGMATGTTVYPSDEVVFQTASVTAGQEKLSGGAGAASGSASKTAKETTAAETGASSTLATSIASTGASPSSTGASPTGSAAPAAVTTGAASKFGIEGAALLALAGAAAVHV